MLVQTQPDTMTKLALIGDATQYEPAGDQPKAEHKRVPYQSHSLAECITNVATPKGKKAVLKTMVTMACERNCHHCPFRAGRSLMKRITFSTDELAHGFDMLQHAHQVDGMFLSSGTVTQFVVEAVGDTDQGTALAEQPSLSTLWTHSCLLFWLQSRYSNSF